MKIGIDLDDVLGQTMASIMQFHNGTYGTHLEMKDMKGYDLWKVWGGTKEEMREKLLAFHRSHYGRNIVPFEGAQKACEELKKDNELFLITARRNVINETKEWIEKFFPDIFSDICFTNHFPPDGRNVTKGEVCNILGIDIMIEDIPEFAFGCVTPHRKVFLFDQLWNRDEVLPEGVTRVHSWKEIMEKIENI